MKRNPNLSKMMKATFKREGNDNDNGGNNGDDPCWSELKLGIWRFMHGPRCMIHRSRILLVLVFVLVLVVC